MKKLEEESNSINKKEQFKLAKLSEFMEFGFMWNELGEIEKKELRYKSEMDKYFNIKSTTGSDGGYSLNYLKNSYSFKI